MALGSKTSTVVQRAGPGSAAAAADARPASRKPSASVLDGGIIRTLVRLALPNVGQLAVITAIGFAAVYFVSGLGTEALAGINLVLPLLGLVSALATPDGAGLRRSR